MPIYGENVYLRAVEERDLSQLLEWRNDPSLRSYFREFRDIPAQSHHKWFLEKMEDKNDISLSICRIDTNALIGHTGLHNIVWVNKSAEFGIYINPVLHGQHFGGDALKTLLEYGFDELNLNRIFGEVYTNNTAKSKYLNMGFVEEGRLRETYWHAGKYYDSWIVSMIRSDYLNLIANDKF